MYLLDTDICSYVIREHSPVVIERFDAVSLSDLNLSVISEAELLFGVKRKKSTRLENQVRGFLRRLEILPWTSREAEIYGDLRKELEETGNRMPQVDLMIAVHALSLGLTLVTNNVRHFERVSGLDVENWAEAV